MYTVVQHSKVNRAGTIRFGTARLAFTYFILSYRAKLYCAGPVQSWCECILSWQWYLYNKIHEFCLEECKDTTCPRPAELEPTVQWLDWPPVPPLLQEHWLLTTGSHHHHHHNYHHHHHPPLQIPAYHQPSNLRCVIYVGSKGTMPVCTPSCGCWCVVIISLFSFFNNNNKLARPSKTYLTLQ